MALIWEADGTVVAPLPSTNPLAAQVLDWQLAQDISDVSPSDPDVLEIEVFS